MTATAADDFMAKARRTLASAKRLLHDEDTEGACNRAYYAMFHAAHVPLCSMGRPPLSGFKTHRGLIAQADAFVREMRAFSASANDP